MLNNMISWNSNGLEKVLLTMIKWLEMFVYVIAKFYYIDWNMHRIIID